MKYLLIPFALLLASCSINDDFASSTIDDQPDGMCVAGFVEDSPGKGTLDIFFVSNYAPALQSITDVSVETANEITDQLGVVLIPH